MSQQPKLSARKRKATLSKPSGGRNREHDPRSSVTPEKSALFLSSIEAGFTLKESLRQAEITDDSYRRLLKRSADFRLKLETAEMKLVMVARSKVANSINQGDMPTVRWFLERKLPEEFGRHADLEEDSWKKNITVILPGSKPHPRIVHDSEV